MSNEFENMGINEDAGLVCDNPNCDWVKVDVKYEEYPEWINKTCPKCGEVVLTQKQYDDYTLFIESLKTLNSMSEEEINEYMIKLIENPDLFKESPVAAQIFEMVQNYVLTGEADLDKLHVSFKDGIEIKIDKK